MAETYSRKLKLALIPCALLSAISTVWAGGEVSGGADTYAPQSAFFRSTDPKKTISICYETRTADFGGDFGVPTKDIENIIQWAFKSWGDYIERKNLHYAAKTGSAGIVSKIGKLQQGCGFGEDLTILFGLDWDIVKKHRALHFKPYAFSATTETSSDHLWNKGFLWVAGPGDVDPEKKIPTWNKLDHRGSPYNYSALKILLLHQIGHIFGNNHVEGTIMSPSIGMRLEEWTDPSPSATFDPQDRDAQVDQQVDLIPNLNGAESFDLADPNPNSLKKAFTQIFGYPPTGTLKAVALRLPVNGTEGRRPDHEAADAGSLDLNFIDSQGGSHSAHIVAKAKISQKDDSSPLFNGQHSNHYRSFGASFIGVLKVDVKGSKRAPMNVIVNYNMNRRLSVIAIEPDGSSTGLNKPLLVSE